MYCGQCGEENRNDRKFCVNCGASLTDYTKPKNNLLMPDDVVRANQMKKRLKALNIFCNVMAVVFILAAVALVVIPYLITKDIDANIVYNIFAIICLAFSAISFLSSAIARAKYKRMC